MSRHAPTTRRTGLVVALGGAVHLAVVGLLWTWFGLSIDPAAEPVLFGYVVAGAALTGAVSAHLSTAYRLVTPTLVVISALLVAAYGNWSTDVSTSPAPTPVGPTPFGWYLLGWVAVVGLALGAGGVEYGLGRFLGPDPDERTGSSD